MAEKACHVVASTAQVGLIQALGAMDKDQRAETVYAPPVAEIRGALKTSSPLLRFWGTCLFFAIPLPVLALEILGSEGTRSTAASLIIFFIAWLAPLTWILLPELKVPGGFKRLTLQRILLLSVGFFLSITILSTMLWFLAGLAYMIFTWLPTIA